MIGRLLVLALCALSTNAANAQEAIADSAWLHAELEQFRLRSGFPAVGASVVVRDRIVAASVAGVRKHGEPEAARENDRFHLGSVAKPVSVTMFARLVDQGFLR